MRISYLAVFAVGAMVALAAAPASAGQAGAANPIGRWLTGSDGGVIEIEPCGDDGLCGRIVGITLDHPNDPMPTDSRGQPQCGLTIISDARKTGPGEWTGRITDPRNGKTYNVRLTLDADARLDVRGYVGLPLFGQTVVWQPFAGRIGDRCRIIASATREAGAAD